MRAGRLVNLLLLLERRGRLTAPELASELEVSVRTVLRDIEALSGAGVPVLAIRGASGGFELLDGYGSRLPSTESWSRTPTAPGRPRRATVRVTREGRRLAAVMQVLQPLRMRPSVPADSEGRDVASFRMGGLEMTARQVLSLGPEVEVLEPAALRDRVAELAVSTAESYVRSSWSSSGTGAPGR